MYLYSLHLALLIGACTFFPFTLYQVYNQYLIPAPLAAVTFSTYLLFIVMHSLLCIVFLHCRTQKHTIANNVSEVNDWCLNMVFRRVLLPHCSPPSSGARPLDV